MGNAATPLKSAASATAASPDDVAQQVGRLHAFAQRLFRSHDDVDDAVQHALVVALGDVPFLPRNQLWRRLKDIVKSKALEAQRRRKRGIDFTGDELKNLGALDSHCDRIELRDAAIYWCDQARDVLTSLPVHQAAAFELVVVEGLQIEAAASRLRRSPAQVSRDYRDAGARILAELKRRGADPSDFVSSTVNGALSRRVGGWKGLTNVLGLVVVFATAIGTFQIGEFESPSLSKDLSGVTAAPQDEGVATALESNQKAKDESEQPIDLEGYSERGVHMQPDGWWAVHWPGTSTVMRRWQGSKDKIDGSCVHYRRDGTLHLRTQYSKGQRHGVEELYASDGTVTSVSYWAHGKPVDQGAPEGDEQDRNEATQDTEGSEETESNEQNSVDESEDLSTRAVNDGSDVQRVNVNDGTEHVSRIPAGGIISEESTHWTDDNGLVKTLTSYLTSLAADGSTFKQKHGPEKHYSRSGELTHEIRFDRGKEIEAHFYGRDGKLRERREYIGERINEDGKTVKLAKAYAYLTLPTGGEPMELGPGDVEDGQEFRAFSIEIKKDHWWCFGACIDPEGSACDEHQTSDQVAVNAAEN